MRKCTNPKCGDDLEDLTLFCPSCRYIGRWGMFLGGLLIGIGVAISKIWF